MGNICTSSSNYSYREDQGSIRNTDANTLLNGNNDKAIDKWDVDDVYYWLSSIDDGVLYELAIQFKQSRIRGRVLDSVTEPQLIEMGIPLGDRILFKKVKDELFAKYKYIPNTILIDNNSNPTPIHPAPDIANQSHCSNHSIHSHHSSGHEHDGHSSAVLLPLPPNINVSNTNPNKNIITIEGEGGMSTEDIINATTTSTSPYNNTSSQQQQQQHQQQQALHPTHPSHASYTSHSSHPTQTTMHRARPISMSHSTHSPHNTRHSPIQQAIYYQAIPIQHQQPPIPQRTVSNPIHSHLPSSISPISNISHNIAPSSIAPPPLPSTALTSTALTSSSSHQSVADDMPLPIVDENQYVAVDPNLIEGGIELFVASSPKESDTLTPTQKITKKPPLARSVSADEYKKQQNQLKQMKVKTKQFKSISNPIIPHHSTQPLHHTQSQSIHTDSKHTVLKIAKYLKTSMENELKSADEIREILKKHLCDDIDIDIMDNNKYQQIYDELLTSKLLTFTNCNDGHIKSEEIDTTKRSKLSFNHSVYNKMTMDPQLQSKSCSNIPNIHVNTDRKYCGGTQVMVYSPKSNKWRQGLILKFNENTSTGRICCYNSMGKQSIKDLTLPNVHVKPFVDHHYAHIATNNIQQQPQQPQQAQQPQQQQQQAQQTSIIQQPQNHMPMTVASWNNYIRDGGRPIIQQQQQYNSLK